MHAIITALHARRHGLAFAAGLFAFYGAWLALWLSGDGALYAWAASHYGFDPVVIRGRAMPLPFFDLQGVLSWSECARRGVDVFVTNPCDPIGRMSNYSPLLASPIFGIIGTARTLPLGLAVGVIMLAVLPFVVRPRNWREVAVGWLAACSPATVYALERCNIDVVVFAAVAAALLFSARRVRAIWIAGFVFGLAKFYPFCLLLTALRERRRVFVAVAAAAVAAVAVLYLTHRHAFAVMAVPGSDWFGDTFSAEQIAYGLANLARIKLYYAATVLPLFFVACGRWAWKLSTRFADLLPPAAWNEPEYALLLFSAVTMSACFVLHPSLYYRAVFLVAALPGLWRLRDAAGPDLRKLLDWTLAALIACLWAEAARVHFTLTAGRVARFAVEATTLAVRETLWWFEISVLTGLVLAFVRRTPVFVRR